MNTNFFRTIVGFFAGSGILVTIVRLAGCSIDDPATVAIEASTCAGSTLLASINPLAPAIGTFVLLLLGGIAKAFYKTGTVSENLAAPSVPVVSAVEARPGVVTPGQVASSGTNK